MAPRKSAAAEEDGDCPMLKLVMEKGRLSGQSNEFRPGSTIKIGRVVRGNTLPIKEAGISTKHLVIQVESVSDPGRRSWTITDLGSSNGTFLNGEQLKPSEPAVLSDGDIVKIGEQTTIKVKFEANEVENEVSSSKVRRNPRRRAKNHDADLIVIDENAELRLVDGNKELGPSGVNKLQGASTRITRSSRKQENVGKIGIDLSVIEGKRTRGGGRGRKKLPVETLLGETEKEESKTCDEEKTKAEVGVDEEGGGAGCASTSGVKKDNVEDGNGEMFADLNTMTLGEWFDFLEVYLPKQIINETEAMISEMEQKTKRFHEFQKNANGNG